MGDVIHFPGDHAARLRELSQRERESKDAHTHDLRARNLAIIEAIKDKYPQNRAARDCGLKPPSITRILGLPPSSLGIFEGDDAA